jgi:hypothetical protein
VACGFDHRPQLEQLTRGDHAPRFQHPQGFPDDGPGSWNRADVFGDDRLVGSEVALDDEPAELVDDPGVKVEPARLWESH